MQIKCREHPQNPEKHTLKDGHFFIGKIHYMDFPSLLQLELPFINFKLHYFVVVVVYWQCLFFCHKHDPILSIPIIKGM